MGRPVDRITGVSWSKNRFLASSFSRMVQSYTPVIAQRQASRRRAYDA